MDIGHKCFAWQRKSALIARPLPSHVASCQLLSPPLYVIPWTLLRRPSRQQKRWGSCNAGSLLRPRDDLILLQTLSEGVEGSSRTHVSLSFSAPFSFLTIKLWSGRRRRRRTGKMAVVRSRPLALYFSKIMQGIKNNFNLDSIPRIWHKCIRNSGWSRYIVVGQQQPVPELARCRSSSSAGASSASEQPAASRLCASPLSRLECGNFKYRPNKWMW